jgi:hypothetical protein
MNIAFFASLVAHLAVGMCIFALRAPKLVSAESARPAAGTLRVQFVSRNTSIKTESSQSLHVPFPKTPQSKITYPTSHAVLKSSKKAWAAPTPVKRVELENVPIPVSVKLPGGRKVADEEQLKDESANQVDKIDPSPTLPELDDLPGDASRNSTSQNTVPILKNPFGDLTVPPQFQRRSFFPRRYTAHFVLHNSSRKSDYQLISFSPAGQRSTFLDAEIEKLFRKQLRTLKSEFVVSVLIQHLNESIDSTQDSSTDVQILIEILE